MRKPKLDEITQLLETGKDFSLTDRQYQKSTGNNIPKSYYYLLNDSAVARLSKKYGFKVTLVEKTIMFQKESN